ncbi:MAG: glycoside hydrolase family 140 protein [Clostridia bacterium]|nr:glycoside hydrolase family 140 protein [Clostridia bacterium]
MLTVKQGYLYEDGKPFFWLADTAWLIYENLEENEAEEYIKNRASLGFNVLQTVLFYSLPERKSIKDGMPVKGKNQFCEEHFAYVEKVFKIAKKYNMYIALVPCWGSYVKNKVLTLQDIPRFTDFLTERFAHNDNLIWILGGDVKGEENPELFNAFGNTLKQKDGKHLITYHPFGRTFSARWFNEEKWLDFNMFQSGHRRYDQALLNEWDDYTQIYYGEDNWRYIQERKQYKTFKPCLDAEPSYEGIVQGLHDYDEPYWEACDVRRYAYWSLLEGACGFTYGNNAIIQFYTDELPYGAYGIRESWKTALHAEGAGQLQLIKKLFESVDFTSGGPRTDLLVTPQKERYHRISVFAGKGFLFAYTYTGDRFSLSLDYFNGGTVEGYWFNPASGAKSYISAFEGRGSVSFRPAKRRELSNDWLLILQSV